MQLHHISTGLLVMFARGDPWKINRSLQNGRPAQISDLAQAFHNAGQCTTEASNAFLEARRRFEAAWNRENREHPINDSAEVQRATSSLGVQAAQLPKIAVDLENIAAALAQAQRTCSVLISSLETQLQQLDNEIGQAEELEKDGHLSEPDKQQLDQHISDLEHQAIDDTKDSLAQLQSIRSGYSDYLQKSQANLRTDGYDPAAIQALDAPESPPTPDLEADRRQNQVDAFTQVFGRPPTSAADWETAAALDPHSYDPKNAGTPPNIAVGTITPHPGQGVVRVNLFIPGSSAIDPQPANLARGARPWDDNLGDNRGFSPNAGPGASRVSILVDYENGIIVARQNPSVNASTGEVRTGMPSVSAVQRSDGGILLRYNAADPFSPGDEGLAKHTMSVNGELAIVLRAGGPVVGGNITNFPAIEIYHDGAAGPPQILAEQWPLFVDGSAGPAAGLWWHRPIGDASLVLGFNDQYPPLPAALPGAGAGPALIPQHGPPVMPAAPPLISTPPGLSDLGPVAAPPSVRQHDPVIQLPWLPR